MYSWIFVRSNETSDALIKGLNCLFDTRLSPCHLISCLIYKNAHVAVFTKLWYNIFLPPQDNRSSLWNMYFNILSFAVFFWDSLSHFSAFQYFVIFLLHKDFKNNILHHLKPLTHLCIRRAEPSRAFLRWVIFIPQIQTAFDQSI